MLAKFSNANPRHIRIVASWGFHGDAFARTLQQVINGGSDTGRTINETLATPAEAFVWHRPCSLTPYPGVVVSLERLAQRVPVACLTDGDPPVHRADVVALGVNQYFHRILITEEAGDRSRRKSDLFGLERIAVDLKLALSELVIIGDPR